MSFKGGAIRAQPALLLGFAFFALLALGQQQNATEDQVKAAYLLNFAKLGEWPHTALAEGSSALVIGVNGGEEEFFAMLRAALAGKSVGAHPVVVKHANSREDMKACNIVFFRGSEKKHAQVDIDELTQASVLLVGEDESFLRQGGMINLVRDHGSIRFEVDPDALDRSHIHFSSKILALARSGYGASPTSAAAAALPSPAEGLRRLERSTPPEYPDIAKRMNLTGTAQVQIVVKADGTVSDVKILGGHPLLADALAHAVMQWKYQPAPRETTEVVKFSFPPQ